MKQRKYAFHFARILITGRPDDETKTQFYEKGLLAKVKHTDRFFRYMFVDTEKILINQDTFFFGRLIKYRPYEEEEVVDEELHGLEKAQIPRAVIAKSEFVIHVDSGIIAFRPISNKMSSHQFREKAAALFESAYDNFFLMIRIEAVEEDYKIEKVFDEFSMINSITIDLHPSNPNFRDIWEVNDSRIRKIGASRLIETVENNDQGLNINAIRQDQVYSGILMAADGYGKAIIQGKKDGKSITVSTSDNPAQEKVRLSDKAVDLIEQLKLRLMEIIRRNHKDEN